MNEIEFDVFIVNNIKNELNRLVNEIRRVEHHLKLIFFNSYPLDNHIHNETTITI